MKSYGVTIQMKLFQKYFHMVLLVLHFRIGRQWTTETIQTKPLICFAYVCQADFEFISLVSTKQ